MVRALYDSPDSLLRHWRMPEELDRRTAEAILFAVARGWGVVQGNHSIRLRCRSSYSLIPAREASMLISLRRIRQTTSATAGNEHIMTSLSERSSLTCGRQNDDKTFPSCGANRVPRGSDGSPCTRTRFYLTIERDCRTRTDGKDALVASGPHSQCTLRPAAHGSRPVRMPPLPGAGLSMRARGIRHMLAA
jgi:hypothetical protein